MYILGSVASGKTTLAKRVSKELKYPWYELDNVFHKRLPGGDRRRPEEERNLMFSKIINSDNWIIEGVLRECFNDGLDKADTIILLDTPPLKRKYRIMKRWIFQNLKLEKCSYKPTIKMLFMMYKWSRSFQESRSEIYKLLEAYSEKLLVIKDSRELYKITEH
ncbi:AAA family ATPase [Clostridium sp. 19966]|nr:AAA family ATPase [Clostridium sp. 19966]MDT8717676.1 AAA family ATPase [Clostridium sp. 19966]